MRVTLIELIDYLEHKIKYNEQSTDEEYGLYLEYKRYGKRVFKDSDNRLLIKQLKREIQDMHDDEG